MERLENAHVIMDGKVKIALNNKLNSAHQTVMVTVYAVPNQENVVVIQAGKVMLAQKKSKLTLTAKILKLIQHANHGKEKDIVKENMPTI